MTAARALALALLALAAPLGCGGPPAPAPGPAALTVWRDFDGSRALAHARAQCDIGPRPSGSPALKRTRSLIQRRLAAAGWDVREARFTAMTPRGEVEFVNLRARFPAAGSPTADWATGGRIVLASHYETKRMPGIAFTGANDPAASSAALLEIARIAAAKPTFASALELAFFDGEECFVRYGPFLGQDGRSHHDGFYGSRRRAAQIAAGPRTQRPRAVIVLDLIGDREMRISIPTNSSAILRKRLHADAAAAGHGVFFDDWTGPVQDDHTPFHALGIPALNIIDADYISRGRWHTADDHVGNLRAKSIEIVGQVATLHAERLARDAARTP